MENIGDYIQALEKENRVQAQEIKILQDKIKALEDKIKTIKEFYEE